MPVNLEYNLLFIHIPKTGGTSIEQFFGMMQPRALWFGGGAIFVEGGVHFAPQHFTANILRERLGESYSRLFKFSFVRDPTSRVLSEYFGSAGGSRTDLVLDEFSSWLDSYYSARDSDHKLCQRDFLYDESGRLQVDFLGRFENLAEDFGKLLRQVGHPDWHAKLPRTNESHNRGDYLRCLNEEVRGKIYRLFEADFLTFGYPKP
ncbi:MAG: sulfotransferase family 2 domain-containing protein [Verrucomicrobia bacterium]|nr:sulfotransferase family 2 domain-containing protein [Verrucomicrobiota bacterium]